MYHIVNELTKESAFKNKIKREIISPLVERKGILVHDVITTTFLREVLICDWLLPYHSTGCGSSFLTSLPVLKLFWNVRQ
jgi:hypothetical protein